MHETTVHEQAVVRSFIAPARRGRWLEALAAPERRSLFLDRLNHCTDLDPGYVTPVASAVEVVSLLRSRGAPETCYLVSAAAELDGSELSLEQAVSEVEKAGWGSIISFIPGRLAYYHDECGERRWVLERPD